MGSKWFPLEMILRKPTMGSGGIYEAQEHVGEAGPCGMLSPLGPPKPQVR